MPTTAEVLEQVTDILVRVVNCPADDVVPDATLTDLGVDSLTIVELGEELGRRFDRYLSDDTIDGLVTVADAVDAIAAPGASTASARTPGENTSTTLHAPPPPPRRDPDHKRGVIATFAFWMAITGIALGAVIGFGGAALVSATGLDSIDLPPLAAPTSEATTSAPEPTTPEPTTPASSAAPEPTIVASSESISPGERVRITGRIPTSEEGATLQVQVKDGDSAWDDFPVDTEAREDGTFATEIYTSRTGERQIRLIDPASGDASPSVTIRIG